MTQPATDDRITVCILAETPIRAILSLDDLQVTPSAARVKEVNDLARSGRDAVVADGAGLRARGKSNNADEGQEKRDRRERYA